MENNIGVYKITNILNKKCYVGSSKNIKKRWYEHVRTLKNGNHHSKKLQRAFNKYGENNFSFKILEYCEESELLNVEQRHFDLINPEYIILKTAGRFDGYKHTEETKKIIKEKRKTQIMKPCSDETKDKISEANKGRIFTKEHKDKLSKSHVGKILSESHKEKIKNKCIKELMSERQKLSVISRKKNNKKLTHERRIEISKQNSKELKGFDINGNLIYHFESYIEACKMLGVSESTLWRMINSNGNYKNRKYKNIIWEKKDYAQS